MGLFVVTALAELPYLWLKEGKPLWLLFPAVISLALFVWLTHTSQAAGRVYAAYGGVYICVALMMWLWGIEAVRPAITDWIGVGICLTGVIVIMFGAQVIKPA